MTTHAYIADLNRERPSLPNRAEALAMVGVCGVQYGRGCDDLRCFGLRRLALYWPLQGHHVDCPACRSEIRRLLSERTDPEREARIAALTEWAEANPLRGADDSLKAEAQRRRMETQRRKERAARAAASPERVQGVCEFCGEGARAAWDYTCNALPCRVKRAKVTREKRARRAAS